MRTLLVLIFLIIYFILGIPIFILEFIIEQFNPKLRAKIAQKIVSKAFKYILFISGVKATVKGIENIPKDQAVLYVANHQSYFDILLGYSYVPNITGFVAKKSMTKIPFLRIWMKLVNCLFLDRDNIKEGLKTILQGIEMVKDGISIFIFPEGTRSKTGEVGHFKEGSLKIAEKSGCPIIPVVINNTSNIFEKHVPWIKGAYVSIEFCEPIYTKDLPKEQKKFLGAYVQNIIKEILDKERSLL